MRPIVPSAPPSDLHPQDERDAVVIDLGRARWLKIIRELRAETPDGGDAA